MLQDLPLVKFHLLKNWLTVSSSTFWYNKVFLVKSIVVSCPGWCSKAAWNHNISTTMLYNWEGSFGKMLTWFSPNKSSGTIDKLSLHCLSRASCLGVHKQDLLLPWCFFWTAKISFWHLKHVLVYVVSFWWEAHALWL